MTKLALQLLPRGQKLTNKRMKVLLSNLLGRQLQVPSFGNAKLGLNLNFTIL